MDNDARIADTAVAPEKMLSQSEVNSIVGHAKAAAADKARRDTEAQYQAEITELKSGVQPGLGGMSQPDMQEQVRQLMAQERAQEQAKAEQEQAEAQKAQYEQHVNEVAGKFLDKYSKGKDLYDDFEEVTADFDPRGFPELVFLTADLDNAADVMYELNKSPTKLSSINGLARSAPKIAQKQLAQLSESIKANKDALEEQPQQSNAPLPRIKSSVNAGGDSGDVKIRDLRKQSYLRA